jgi:hypothetical protein
MGKKDWTDDIGKKAYRIKDNKIQKQTIIEGRLSYHLNTGSDRHGRLLDEKIEFRFHGDPNWYKRKEIFLTKEELFETL